MQSQKYSASTWESSMTDLLPKMEHTKDRCETSTDYSRMGQSCIAENKQAEEAEEKEEIAETALAVGERKNRCFSTPPKRRQTAPCWAWMAVTTVVTARTLVAVMVVVTDLDDRGESGESSDNDEIAMVTVVTNSSDDNGGPR
jgi:hypothetical protein